MGLYCPLTISSEDIEGFDLLRVDSGDEEGYGSVEDPDLVGIEGCVVRGGKGGNGFFTGLLLSLTGGLKGERLA